MYCSLNYSCLLSRFSVHITTLVYYCCFLFTEVLLFTIAVFFSQKYSCLILLFLFTEVLLFTIVVFCSKKYSCLILLLLFPEVLWFIIAVSVHWSTLAEVILLFSVYRSTLVLILQFLFTEVHWFTYCCLLIRELLLFDFMIFFQIPSIISGGSSWSYYIRNQTGLCVH